MMQKIVIMGVAGCGKTTVGEELARVTGWEYMDGDTLHPQANIVKMSAGIPLTDNDRWPWLEAVGAKLATSPGSTIIGCSALKRAYRDKIRAYAGGPVTFVHLAGSRELISARMKARTGHFMPATLLDSQFATLEPPQEDETAITIDVADTLEASIGKLVTLLKENTR